MYLFHVCFTETSFCFVCSILALRLAFAFLFGCSMSKNPLTHYLSTLLQSSRRFLWEYVSLFQFLEDCVQLQLRWLCRIDDLAVLFYLQINIVTTLPYWWFCRIDDSAVLFCLQLQYGCSAVLRTLPYCSTSRVFCSSFLCECQWSLIGLERFSSLCGPLSLLVLRITFSNEWVKTILRWNGPKQTAWVLTNQDTIIPARENELNKARVSCTFIFSLLLQINRKQM